MSIFAIGLLGGVPRSARHRHSFFWGQDLRPDSARYGRWCGGELSSDDSRGMFVPRGFAHGFCTLADDTVVAYKMDAAYSRPDEAGIVWNDPTIGIDWPVDAGEAILSDRDRSLPAFDAAAVTARS